MGKHRFNVNNSGFPLTPVDHSGWHLFLEISFFFSLSLFVFFLSFFLVIAINSCCNAILLVHMCKCASSFLQIIDFFILPSTSSIFVSFFMLEYFKVITYPEYFSSTLFFSSEVFVMSQMSEVYASCNCSRVEDKNR